MPNGFTAGQLTPYVTNDSYTPTDNASWTPVVHVNTPGIYKGSKWYKKVYTPQTALPSGTTYLKVELSGSHSWEKQVSEMVIHYAP